MQIILDADVLSVSVDGRGAFSASTNDRMMGFGPIALYAGGAGEVRFKEVSYKNLNRKTEPKETVSRNFQMQRISDFYYAWCAAVADINHDGVNDVTAGALYFLGPEYTERGELTAARTHNPSNQFSQGMVNFAYDFTGDGWPDILMQDTRPIYLYVNPRGEPRRWDRYNVVPQVTSEIVLLKDIDGDGKPEVLFGGDGAMAYAKPDPERPTAPWIVRKVSERGFMSGHGMGVGDINGDGRMDITTPRGWWEQPPKGSTQETWTHHAASFGVGGAEMGIYDVNGDGLNDVVTVLNAHGWGLAWFEQKRDKDGAISFVKHAHYGRFFDEKRRRCDLFRAAWRDLWRSRWRRYSGLDHGKARLFASGELPRSRPLRSRRPVLVSNRAESESGGWSGVCSGADPQSLGSRFSPPSRGHRQ